MSVLPNPAANRAHVARSGKDGVRLLDFGAAGPPAGALVRRIRTEDGVSLRTAFWPDRGARGSVLVFPGRTELVEFYYETVAFARSEGFAAAAVDWRNQGLNSRPLADRRKGHVRRFGDYRLDADAFAAAAREAGLPRPWFAFAHSMGGAIAQAHAAGSEAPPDGLVLVAPMLGINTGPAPARAVEAVAGAGARLGLGQAYVPGAGPRTVMERPFAGNPLTADRETFDRVGDLYRREPEAPLGGPTWRWLHEALAGTRRLGRLRPLGVPMLGILADRERVVDNRRTEALLAREPSARRVVLADCLHCPHLERAAVRDRLFGSVRDFLNEHA